MFRSKPRRFSGRNHAFQTLEVRRALASDLNQPVAGKPALVGSPQGGTSDPGPQIQKTAEYCAKLGTPSGVHGGAKYLAGTLNGAAVSGFLVVVDGAAAGTVYNVLVDGVSVGELVVNPQGHGAFALSNLPGSDARPIPSGFPQVHEGSTISLGEGLSGVFQKPTDPPQPTPNETHVRLIGGAKNDTGLRTVVRYCADSEHGLLHQGFMAELNGGQAGKTYSVVVNGVVVGQITADSSGAGRLALSNDGRPNTQPMGADFPQVADGATFQVGETLSGALRNEPPPPSPSEGGVSLGAQFKNESGATGSVHFRSETVNGMQLMGFMAEVNGAAANTTYDVTVNGVVVGQIKTDATGHGVLRLSNFKLPGTQPMPENFPAVGENATVGIGNVLAGSLQKEPKRDDFGKNSGDQGPKPNNPGSQGDNKGGSKPGDNKSADNKKPTPPAPNNNGGSTKPGDNKKPAPPKPNSNGGNSKPGDNKNSGKPVTPPAPPKPGKK